MTRPVVGVLALALLAACAVPPTAPPLATLPGTVGAPGQPLQGPPGAGPVASASLGARPVRAAYPRSPGPRGGAVAESTAVGAERAFVTALLADLQIRSFRENREFCGYLGLDGAGRLAATPAAGGSEAACVLPRAPDSLTLVASYHTHGTYSPFYASEWPTSQDVATDAADAVDGYIATPGGRLWHVDSDSMTVRELCGRGCLPQDPRYRAEEDGPLRPLMTYRDLQAWETGWSP